MTTIGAVVLVAGLARGDELERVPAVTNEVALKECGACHLAYQPGLLPAESWRRLFGQLDDHFGEDASLDEATRQGLLDYYVAGADPQAPRDGTPLRITERGWWVRVHGAGEVREAEWARARFKGNCTACHQRAEQGVYEDE